MTALDNLLISVINHAYLDGFITDSEADALEREFIDDGE